MSQQQTPLFFEEEDTFYSYPIDIQGQTFHFEFYFSTRGDAWYLHISDSNEEPLLVGLKLTHLGNIIPRNFNPRMFKAAMTLGRDDGLLQDPSKDDLQSCTLFYLDGIDRYLFSIKPTVSYVRIK